MMRRISTFVAAGAVLIAAQTGAVAQEPAPGTLVPVPIIELPRNSNPISAEEEERLRAEETAPARTKLGAAFGLLKKGEWEAAAKAALEAKELLPRGRGYGFVLIDVNQVLAFVRIREGRYREALQLLEEIRPKGMNADPRSELMIALCFARLGQMDDARRCYEVGNKGSQVLRIVFEGDAAQMARSLPSMASDRGVEANILFALGFDLFYGSGRQEMLWYLESAAKAAPYDGVIAFYTGRTLQHLDRLPEALPYYRRAAVSSPARLRKEAVKRLPREERAKYQKPE